MNNTRYIPRTYLHYHRQLRALLISHEAWFSAKDLSRLLSCHFSARLPSMLDEDQSRRENLQLPPLPSAHAARAFGEKPEAKTVIAEWTPVSSEPRARDA